MLKVGTVGAVAAGAAMAGGPKVLGLGSSPAYAAGASTPDSTTTTTLPPNQSTIAVLVGLQTGNGENFILPALDYSSLQARLYDAATGGTVLRTVGTGAAEGNSNVSWTFYNLPAGTYYVEIQEVLSALDALLPESQVSATAPRIAVVVTSVSQVLPASTTARFA